MSWAMRIARLTIANHLRKANVRKRAVPLRPELQDAIACTAESSRVRRLKGDHALQRGFVAARSAAKVMYD